MFRSDSLKGLGVGGDIVCAEANEDTWTFEFKEIDISRQHELNTLGKDARINPVKLTVHGAKLKQLSSQIGPDFKTDLSMDDIPQLLAVLKGATMFRCDDWFSDDLYMYVDIYDEQLKRGFKGPYLLLFAYQSISVTWQNIVAKDYFNLSDKKITCNSLHQLDFHDCFVLEAKQDGNDLLWAIKPMNVLKDNPVNPYKKAMQTSQAIIVFENAKYTEAEKNYGVSQLDVDEDVFENLTKENIRDYARHEQMTALDADTIHAKIAGEVIYGHGQEDDTHVRFDVNGRDCLLILNVVFSNVVVYWHGFDKPAWYERDRWRMSNANEEQQNNE